LIAQYLRQGLAGSPEPTPLAAPVQIAGRTRNELAWEPVENAESYLVEWDMRDPKGWLFDREGSVRVIPTRETSITFEYPPSALGVRWRVSAVPRLGNHGNPSGWREIR
jgi:hypothetical protein